MTLAEVGYPDAPQPGGTILGLDAIGGGDVRAYYAGAERDGGRWRVSGGRAAYLTARGTDVERARRGVMRALDGLGGDGWRARRDIAAVHAACSPRTESGPGGAA